MPNKRGPSRPTIIRMAIENDDSDDGPLLRDAVVTLVERCRELAGDEVYDWSRMSQASAAEALWSIGRLAGRLCD